LYELRKLLVKENKAMNEEIPEENKIEAVEEVIKSKIYIIRGHKVMLDFDIADLYQIKTKVLIQSIHRNLSRFPEDFMFQLVEEEWLSLRSQTVTSKIGRGGRRYLPYVFTDYGVAMLSSVLNSEKAVHMNIFIIRVFVKIKEWILSNEELKVKVGEIEKKQKEQGDLLNNVNSVVTQLLTTPPLKQKGKVGFNHQESDILPS
jgi:hypothetical protein